MSETTAESRFDQIKTLVDEIRPYLQGDGGDCELMSVEESGDVLLRFVGACQGCPSSSATLKMGIENFLKEKAPWVREVKQVF